VTLTIVPATADRWDDLAGLFSTRGDPSPRYLLADTAVVGHLGTPQLAGLAVASTVLNAGYAVFIFLAYGTTAAVARRAGVRHRCVGGIRPSVPTEVSREPVRRR